MSVESKIVDHYVEDYIRSLLNENENHLKVLEDFAHEHAVPIIHPEIAQYFKVLFKMVKPQRVLEVGTAIGYSASLMALEMQTGHIDTLEQNEVMIEKAKETFDKLRELGTTETSICIHQGDARETLNALEGPYDIVFIDAAKGHYQVFFDEAIDKVRPGGIIVSDNVLYKGMVATNEYLVRRKITIVKRMRKYLANISDHPMVETTIMPMGDGLAISYKKEK